ncbi:CDP-alcohol phosphatidyltransferase family protein [Rhizorhapis sp. SPR117]|uniref:CDP-alcohol phosphatidyltransferase family protein n=1 Tax=Rhizorhapis sp. SPR117 TaxID=2912611 RepID=UPI001F42E2D8|nr:CDP-alcohol phosphatidyltransferase family protein [Rhizorhapis sp. SPR117]
MQLHFAGHNDTRIWGMDNEERIRRLAHAATLAPGGKDDPALWINLEFAFDPLWFRYLLKRPGTVLIARGKPVLAHLPSSSDRGWLDVMLTSGVMAAPAGFAVIDHDERPQIYNDSLRKLECPFVEPLTPQTVRSIERQSYYGAYKGVTDILTKYLWPELALVLTRVAARIGMTPNMVTMIGAALCVYATWLFYFGHFWAGIAAGFVFMVLDTVDGKLARCTITSSWWGNVFDHGIDLVHPPFWWYAWGVGVAVVGLPLGEETFLIVMATIVIGYVVQRLIEGAFIKSFGIHIHVWRPFDSRFRLITARRNPNMALLVGSLVVGRPDTGLVLVAWWTVISCAIHAVRLGQAYWARQSGGKVTSWLEQAV